MKARLKVTSAQKGTAERLRKVRNFYPERKNNVNIRK